MFKERRIGPGPLPWGTPHFNVCDTKTPKLFIFFISAICQMQHSNLTIFKPVEILRLFTAINKAVSVLQLVRLPDWNLSVYSKAFPSSIFLSSFSYCTYITLYPPSSSPPPRWPDVPKRKSKNSQCSVKSMSGKDLSFSFCCHLQTSKWTQFKTGFF